MRENELGWLRRRACGGVGPFDAFLALPALTSVQTMGGLFSALFGASGPRFVPPGAEDKCFTPPWANQIKDPQIVFFDIAVDGKEVSFVVVTQPRVRATSHLTGVCAVT